ncbi:UDP-glucuronosyl/UDP-glucosyltransferase [Parasponia andersonii]|uniref:UDP-glucuronosyl/UDP-glucosyltransferase n=1 Tax=Parasponia andersonii TaxID=3476 RepID=A0A2P5B2J6_PARAD|nr:UDP-glucuronosyl/UDP-glucosyltransferase [Parasponia andersonii]
MLRSQLPDWSGLGSELLEAIGESEKKTYGAVMNSFSELDQDYVEYLRDKLGVKAWSLGPVSLWMNKDYSDRAERGQTIINTGTEHYSYDNLLNWLNSKDHNSVLYVSFGSLTRFRTTQLVEIAHGLEASGHPFIWVVRTKENDDDDEEESKVFIESFEERVKDNKRCLIIREWAPQVLILEHPAIGGVVTHCGWNSILEAVTAGLPMITWPLFAEQFYNEKFLTEVVRVGVSVGVKRWSFDWWHMEKEVVVKREEIEKAVRFLMGGEEEEALEMRKRVKKISEAAKMAVESGGSSQCNLTALINELRSLKIRY